MNLSIIDAIIIIVILFFAAIGFKRGIFEQLVLLVGIIVIVILSYNFKNVIGDFLVLNLPFFKFSNFLNGATTLNIVLYQLIAFIIIFILAFIVFKIILAITGLIEKLLRFTIILGIPSKILGLIAGLIEGYIIIYLSLFFLNQPIFKFDFMADSKYATKILDRTPILSKFLNNSLEVMNDIYDLKNIKDVDELNYKVIELVIDKKVTSIEVVESLQNKGKINVKNIDKIIEQYRK